MSNPLRVLTMLAAFLLAACQPTPEERIARAEEYMEVAEYRSAIIELKNVLQADADDFVARQMLAESAYLLNDLATAESEYRRVLAHIPEDPALWAAYAETLLAWGKAAEALERAAPELESLPPTGASLAVLGDIYRGLGNLEEARETYRDALDVEPGNVRATLGLALTAAMRGNLDAAREILAAVQVDAANASDVWRTRGNVAAMSKRFADAAEHYGRAVETETPRTPAGLRFQSRYNRVAALIEARMLDEAQNQLDALTQFATDDTMLAFQRGRVAFGRGDYDEAEEHLLRHLAAAPDDTRAKAILGAIHFSKNELLQAEQYLSNAVRHDVGGDMTRRLLAETLLRLDRPAAAADSLTSPQAGIAADAVTLALLGRAKLGEGDAAAAIEFFQQSLVRDDTDEGVGLALASSYLLDGRAVDAVKVLEQMPPGPAGDYRREMLLMGAYMAEDNNAAASALGETVLQNHTEDAAAHALVGVLYANLGDAARARATLETALSLDEQNSGALYAMGALAAGDGEYQQAIGYFSSLLDSEPAHLPALTQLTTALQASGQLAAVRPRIVAAQSAYPDSTQLARLSARVDLMLGEIARAAETIRVGRQALPSDPGFLHLEGLVRLAEGDAESGLSSLSRAARAEPRNASVQLDLASAYLENRQYSQALRAIRAFRAQRPRDVRGLAIEVDAELRSGDPDQAREAVDAFARRAPDEQFVWMLYGDIEFASNNPARAVEFYERAASAGLNRLLALRLTGAHQAAGTGGAKRHVEQWLDREPQDADMRRVYAQLLEADGANDDAVAQYERLAESGELDAIGMNNLAWQYMLRDDRRAIGLAEQARELAPNNGQIADTLGWILYRNGRIERARAVLREAVALAPENAEIRYHLAAVLAESGESAEARRIVEELIAAGSDFPSRPDAETLLKSL